MPVNASLNVMAGSRQKNESEKTGYQRTSHIDPVNHSYGKTETKNDLRMALATCQSCRYLNGLDNPVVSLTSRSRESLVQSERTSIRTDCRSDRDYL